MQCGARPFNWKIFGDTLKYGQRSDVCSSARSFELKDELCGVGGLQFESPLTEYALGKLSHLKRLRNDGARTSIKNILCYSNGKPLPVRR